MFGDEEILKELIEKAEKRGINIILDGVFSHTGEIVNTLISLEIMML